MSDWAARAAEQIQNEYLKTAPESPELVTNEDVASIISSHAAPLVALLREARREHYHCDDSWYCCPLCDSDDHGGPGAGGAYKKPGECTCGADAFNARIDALLNR